MAGSNPFASLFNQPKNDKGTSLSDILEEIFGFTINPENVSKGRLYLDEVNKVHEKTGLDISLLHYALFERLFMCNDNSELRQNHSNDHSHETKVIKYLYVSFNKLKNLEDKLRVEDFTAIENEIIQNVATAFQPDIYSGQNIADDIMQMLIENEANVILFFNKAATKLLHEENGNTLLLNTIESMNTTLLNEINKSSLVNFNQSLLNYFYALINKEQVAELFLESCFPKPLNVGSKYALSPLGALFNLSVLPKIPMGEYDFFSNPMDQAGNSRTEDYLWVNLAKLNQNIHQLFLMMLRSSPKIKSKTLEWLGNCLQYNSPRGKIWNTHAPELNPAIYTNVSDGFMINLCNLMMRLCQPFCLKIRDEKVLKVDPTYWAVPNEKTEEKNVHMKNMSSDTCFIPVALDDGIEEQRLIADSYSFVTECFFMAHRTIDLGYRVGVDRLIKQNIEMGRIERAFHEALQQAGGNSDLVGTIKDRMSAELTKYLSLKCQLSDPELLSRMFDFVSSSAHWLCQVAVHTDFQSSNSYSPLNELPLNFPLSSKIPDTLKCIPEFIVENMVSFLIFIRNFQQNSFEQQGYDKLSPILTFILIYMGSPQHLRNPHIRARLAEGLESLLPYHKNDNFEKTATSYQRQRLFTEHPHRYDIVENLMKVYVGIEMTGQSVDFEEKFNYRRPMHAVFDYLWDSEYFECFHKLAVEAEKNMEGVNPPLFLKFVNLLINDAIFLLDEALSNMAKLKEMQQAQDNGEWDSLNARDRAQNLGYLSHIGNLARFNNILGKDTIHTLDKLTSRITIVFTHSTMVDRIAAMLNYFLLNLVGPNKKNFKVKDAKQYHFDPAETVREICKIYINLQQSDSFCLAVSQDGRSYSPNLFTLAEDVLIRIGGGTLIGELKEVACKIAERAREFKANEEVLSDAPEHFLDPIMSTLMTDPVILPSSRQTVDRSTIARHLLSDQTDPFNRSPLSMEQVIPNTELAGEIERWIKERKEGAKST